MKVNELMSEGIKFDREKKELTVTLPGLGVWIGQVLDYLRLRREKKRLERENKVLDTLIKMVDNAKTEKDRQTILKFAKDNNIPLPRK